MKKNYAISELRPGMSFVRIEDDCVFVYFVISVIGQQGDWKLSMLLLTNRSSPHVSKHSRIYNYFYSLDTIVFYCHLRSWLPLHEEDERRA